jgi:hypothetical protein
MNWEMDLECVTDDALAEVFRLLLSDKDTRVLAIEELSNAELKALISAALKKDTIRKQVQSRIISALQHKALQLN